MSGAAVKLAEDKGCQLSDLTTQDLQSINKLFEDDVQEVWNFDRYARHVTLCHEGMMLQRQAHA